MTVFLIFSCYDIASLGNAIKGLLVKNNLNHDPASGIGAISISLTGSLKN
jgi:hypothetical protein